MLPLGGRRIRIQLLVAVMLQTTLSRLRRQLPPAGTNRDTWQSGGVGRVDLSLVDGTGTNTPSVEDLLVGAVVHQLLDGLLYGLGGLGIALLDGHGLRGHTNVLAEGLERITGLLDGVAGNRRIGVEDISLTGSHGGSHIGLQLGGLDVDGILAVRFALLVGLVTSSSWVVPVCTATFTPHRFEESTLFGLPFCTTNVEPALK